MTVAISYLALDCCNLTCLRRCQFYCVNFQDGFPLQPFEKDDKPVLDQSEKDNSGDKVEQLEKTPRKMLSRGKMMNRLFVFYYIFYCLVLDFDTEIFKVTRLKKQSGPVVGEIKYFHYPHSVLYILNT